MARRRKKILGLFGSRKRRSGRKQNIPAKCKTGLSACMSGGVDKRKAGPCMRAFWACRRSA